MANNGTGREPFRALVASRSVLTLVEGLGSRLHQTLSPRAAARTTPWKALAGLSAAIDVVKARALAADDRFRLPARMILDTADLALWCLAAADDTDTSEDAVIPGVALAAEAGARLGPGGFLVAACNAAVAATIRHRRGHRLRLEQFSWQLMGASGGWMLTVFARRRRTALEGEHDTDLQARVQGAELAGLHDVVVAREGAIDALQRATALIDLGAPTQAVRRDFTSAFKAAVADAARTQSVYLRDSLALWQSRRNLQPELARTVRVVLEPDDGTILLSGTQASLLHRQLDALDLTGVLDVAVADPGQARRPYGARDLIVAERLIPLPSGIGAKPWTFDAIPTAFLMNIGWLIQPTARHREAVPWSATAWPLAITVGSTAWSARRAERYGRASPRVALGLSFVSTVLYTIVATRTMANPHSDDGVSRFPWVLPLQGYELVRSIVDQELAPIERATALAGIAAVVAIGWRLSPNPRSLRALLAELGWVAGFGLFARRLQTAIGDDAADIAAGIWRDDDAAISAAYEAGRRRAAAAVADALAAAAGTLQQRAPLLDAELRVEAERRLQRVSELLAAAG